MDTKKIGAFLKQCRKEKNLTQEQLAEKFGVSARTVSRWETGTNLPDLSILVELAEYYDVEMRELLDGERSQTMNKEAVHLMNHLLAKTAHTIMGIAAAGTIADIIITIMALNFGLGGFFFFLPFLHVWPPRFILFRQVILIR